MSRLGILLPGGNSDEYRQIRAQLGARGVVFEEVGVGHIGGKARKLVAAPRGTAGRVFHFDAGEVPKLPTDERGPYLPVEEESGHSIYPVDKLLDSLRRRR